METVICGNTVDVLKTLPDKSVQMCVTSPPYFNLRDYSVSEQIGTETTPKQYIERLVDVFHNLHRVLKDDGTLWLNIADTYASKNYDGIKRKELIGIPWTLAFALRADGWYLRQDIIWHKPNAMPESVKDRCGRGHEYLFLLTKSDKYYFDYKAIREPLSPATVNDLKHRKNMHNKGGKKGTFGAEARPDLYRSRAEYVSADGLRNKRSVWTINTSCYSGSHFAVFPEKLVELCILAGCPEGGTVIDVFAGSCTTGVVAKRLNRHFIGIELNPEYCEMGRARLGGSNHACQTDLKL